MQQLQTPGVLNNGNKIGYSMGLFLGNYRGLSIVEHSGGTFGYSTEILRFPEQKFTVICLCNIIAVPANLARKVADLYLADKLRPGASALNPSSNGSFPDPAEFAGKYLDPRTHLTFTFTASNGDLMADGVVLRRNNASQFYDPDEIYVITFESLKGTMQAKFDIKGETYFSGSRIQELHLREPVLASYTGQFRSAELDTVYGLSLEKDTLTLRNRNNPPQKLAPIAKDEFDAGDLGTLAFERDSGGRVVSLRAFTEWARGIAFRKVK